MTFTKCKKLITALALSCCCAVFTLNSCVHEPYVMPAAVRTFDPEICFEQDILPIFVSNCAMSGCHNAGSHENGYTLDNYEHIINKGIVPGNYAASKIWESISNISSGEGKMPRNLPQLNATQLDLIKRWIAAGAVSGGACTSTCDSNNFTYSGAIAPLMQLYCIGCHSSASSAGGSLIDYSSVMTAAVYGKLIGNIAHQSGYNAMPPGIQLTDCQVTQVKKWVANGALNN